jgi:hypothetical protein
MVFFIMNGVVSLVNAEIISCSGTIASNNYITCGDISLYWSTMNSNFGYIYTRHETLFADIKEKVYWSNSYNTHDGLRNIWDFKDASDYTFSSPPLGPVIVFGDTSLDSYQYLGIIPFSQDSLYGALEPVDLFEMDGTRYLTYNLWYDDSGSSDFTSLNPTPSTLSFYATASATQRNGSTTYHGDPGEWLNLHKSDNGYFKFELNGIDEDAVIVDADLTFFQNSIHNEPLNLGIYHGSNDNWSLDNLDTTIGYDTGTLLASSQITSSTSHSNVSFYLNTTAADFQQDVVDQALTLCIIPEANSNDSVYAYFEGSKSSRVRRPYLSVTFSSSLRGDFDQDLDVDGVDLFQFSTYYGNNQLEADLDKDGIVAASDLSLFAQYYGEIEYDR